MPEKRILIVDDNEHIRSLIAMIAEQLDFETFLAENGEEAIKILQCESVNLVLTDYRMPGEVDGKGLTRWVKQNRAGIPVLLITGDDPEIFGEEASPEDAAHGPDAIIFKPFHPSAITVMIATLSRLDRHQ